jgi:hypothetical protein
MVMDCVAPFGTRVDNKRRIRFVETDLTSETFSEA